MAINRSEMGLFKKVVFVCCLSFAVIALCGPVFAYDEDAGDDDPAAMKLSQEIMQKREKAPMIDIKERIEAQRPKPALPEGLTAIREVKVVGSTIIAKEAINKLKAVNENKKLTARQMQRIADKITRAYSRHGYITSYAYIVPEKLADGILEIQVVEGKTGSIEIRGNRYFSTDILRKKISLKEGKLFNFRQLNIDIYRMNRHADRKASVEVDAGTTPGLTNVVVNVKDKAPVHLTLQADNYGADTILYKRYKTYITHNNISGHDDSLTLKVQYAEAGAQKLFDLDYWLPLNNNWKLQFYFMPYKMEDYYYRGDNEETDFEKRARKFYFWFHQYLVNQPDFEFISSYGFTYFDIFWYKPFEEYNEPVKYDTFRILRWSLSFNKADKYGRWIFMNDLQQGIPQMWGGVPKKSDVTSVRGARGDFLKDLITVARRQKLFNGVDFIGKARMQFSSGTLTGVNTFSAGGYCGVIDNRGFPRTQAPGDAGRALTLGFTFPAFFVPKNVNVPYSKTKLFDSLKLFTFWDWSESILKSPKAAAVTGDPLDDKKKVTLRSAGFGLTFTVPDQGLSIRLDVGFPLSSQESVDGDNTRTWWSVTKSF